MRNILFYKYVEIEDIDSLRESQEKLCKELELKGKILIASEGINGCVSGSEENIQRFKDSLQHDVRFSDIAFKEGIAHSHTFKKIFVRKRKEIVTSHFSVDIKKKAPYVEPKELKSWLDKGEEVIMVDARNDYESKIGRFRDALTPSIKTFREWPQFVRKNHSLKHKKIVTYCTGGIRCEKASTYMKEQGFEQVYQLEGGILEYGKQCGNVHWEGKCFVFDQRGAVDIDPHNQSEPITTCFICRTLTSSYHNCKNEQCDERFLSCPDCFEQMDGCCSKNCRGIVERTKIKAVLFS